MIKDIEKVRRHISDQTNKNETNKSKIRKDFNPFIGKYGVYQICSQGVCPPVCLKQNAYRKLNGEEHSKVNKR